MRGKFLLLGVFLSVVISAYLPGIATAEGSITPESFTEKITLRPALTLIIEEDNTEKALNQLNILHGQMAGKGWVLFHLMEYIDDEDFEGFIVTYKTKHE